MEVNILMPSFRYLNSVSTEEEFERLKSNPFIRTGDIVLYNGISYVYSAERKDFTEVSLHEEHHEVVDFFHRFVIGDKIQLKSPTEMEVEVIDYQYHCKDSVPYYVLKSENKVFKMQVFEVDIMTLKDDNDTPLSSLF